MKILKITVQSELKLHECEKSALGYQNGEGLVIKEYGRLINMILYLNAMFQEKSCEVDLTRKVNLKNYVFSTKPLRYSWL